MNQSTLAQPYDVRLYSCKIHSPPVLPFGLFLFVSYTRPAIRTTQGAGGGVIAVVPSQCTPTGKLDETEEAAHGALFLRGVGRWAACGGGGGGGGGGGA